MLPFVLATLFLFSCGNELEMQTRLNSHEEAKRFHEENGMHSTDNITFPDASGNDISLTEYDQRETAKRKAQKAGPGAATGNGNPAATTPPGEMLLYEDRETSTGTIVELFRVGNDLGVRNGAKTSEFTLRQDTFVNDLTTYHWNDGKGSTAGTISIRGADGKTYGPWKAVGQTGQ